MLYSCIRVLDEASGRKCGKTKSGQPYGSAGTKPWLCQACRKFLSENTPNVFSVDIVQFPDTLIPRK